MRGEWIPVLSRTDQPRKTAVLVDSDPRWFEAVEDVLGSVSIDVVGKAESFAVGMVLIERHLPDLVIAEPLGGEEADGLHWLATVRTRFPSLDIIAFSASEDPANIGSVLRSGAKAYVTKGSNPGDVVSAVRQLHDRSMYLHSGPRSEAPSPLPPPHGVDLSKREREILLLVANGLSNEAIAQKLWVSRQTVKFHLSNIYRKLGVANRTAATRWAHRYGLLSRSTDAP